MTAERKVLEQGRAASRKKVGIRDLARMASVDISTVSRALNHDPRVSEARSQAIRELAKREGYRPRPLRSNRTQAIGVLIGSARTDRIGGVGEHFLERIAWIAQQVLSERRMHVNVECVLRGDGMQRLPAIVQENRVDGVLIAGHPPVDLVQRICAHGMPVVAINDSVERLNIACVRSDPSQAIHSAILRLAAWGHRRFGLLMNDLDIPTSKARFDAYRAALADISIEPDPAWLVSDLPHEILGGREGVRELMRRGDIPTAILCCNDWVALGALMELQAGGLNVPNQVSVLGHDDVSFCEDLHPKLSSISRPEQVMVSEAVRLLLEQIEGGPQPPSDERVEGAIVWRDSTGLAPDRLVEPMRTVAADGDAQEFGTTLWTTPEMGAALHPALSP